MTRVLLGLALAVSPQRDEHPSEASRILATYAPRVEARSPAAMAAAATAFIKSLDDKLAKEALTTLWISGTLRWLTDRSRGSAPPATRPAIPSRARGASTRAHR